MDSLCDESSGEPASPSWHREVLLERLARIASGSEQISSWQEAKQRIQGLVRAVQPASDDRGLRP